MYQLTPLAMKHHQVAKKKVFQTNVYFCIPRNHLSHSLEQQQTEITVIIT